MAVISFPLGFKIVASAGSANTGSPIDERQVFGSSTIRTNYDSSFFYEGLLSYTTGTPYHGSGVTSNAGFYYRNSTNAWVGFNADTLDDKHANGTMDSSSSSEADPTTGTNIVNHINYLYTLTSALTSSRTWKSAVATFADLATTYPTPSTGWAAVVNADNIIYVYDGSVWIPTSSNAPSLSSSVDGIVSHTWYTGLSDFITNTTNYTNKSVFGYVAVQNGGSPSAGSPITASTQQDTFTINTIGGLTSTVSGNTITINGSGGGVTPISNFVKWDTASSYYRYYTDKTEAGGVLSNGKLYGSTTNPTATDRLNYDGYFYATKVYSNGLELEPALSNPAGNGYILVSTTGGVRSWIPQGSVGVSLANNVLEWDGTNNYYRPYATQITGTFDTSTTSPSHTTRLNYDGSLWVTNLKMSIGGSDNVTINPSSTTGIVTMNSTSATAVCISSYQSAITSIVGATGASSSMYAGVLGESLGTNSKGVWGDATQSGIGVYGSSTDGIALYGTSATGIGLVINQTTGNTADLIQAGVNSTNVFTVSYNGNVNIPTGSTYQINGVPLSTGVTFPIVGDTQTNAIQLSTNTTHNNSGLLDIYTTSSVNGIRVNTTSSSSGIYVTTTSSSYGIRVVNNSTGKGQYINNTNGGSGLEIDNGPSGVIGFQLSNTSSVGGVGQYITNNTTGVGAFVGYGLKLDNLSNGYGIYITNTSTGVPFSIINSTVITRTVLNPTITTGSSAIAYKLDTDSLTTSGDKLLSIQNNAVEKVSVNYQGVFFPVQATTASAPTYIKGGIYFDTTLNKLRVGGATGWETITSV